jgi:hypothetical protein
MSAKGAEQFISNPIGKIMDQAGIQRPTISIGQYKLDPTALTSPTGFGQIGQLQNVANVTEEKRQERKAAAEDKSNRAADTQAFNDFAAQESTLLTSNQDLMTPVYKSSIGAKKAKQTEALANIFNARKQEAVSRTAAPGIAQTRMI